MASSVLAQSTAASLAGSLTYTTKQGPACRNPSLPVYHTRQSLGRSMLGLPFRHPSFLVAGHSAGHKSQPRSTRRMLSARAEASAEANVQGSTPLEQPETAPGPLLKLAETVAGAAVAFGHTAKKQWWGKNGSAAKRMAMAFAFAALPIVLSGMVGVPSALAAPGRYQRNQTSRGIMYFAMTLLVSVKQVIFIFRGMLLLRIVLTWFPNLPWDRHPLKASRELTDPYLNLFKSIVPVVGNLDLSPLAAFAFMGFFESLIGINEKALKESSLWGATS